MTQSLAIYNEVRSDGRRRFELFEDHIFITGSAARTTFESSIKLTDLRPETNKLWRRHWSCSMGIGSASLGVIALFFAYRANDPSETSDLLTWGVSLLFLGSVIILKTFRKIEFTQFQSQTGIPMLDVAKAGPEKAQYHQFVQLLIEQIRISNSK